MSTFNVFSYLDPALVKEEMGEPYASKSPAVWPSEASALRVDKSLYNTVGKCHRQAYMRMTGFSITNPPDATSAWKWLMGRAIEVGLTDQTKMAGIYAANSVKHFVRDITLSLEFDVISIDPLTKRGYILECKSYSGYYAKKEIETMNKPKLENLIQICLYILEARTGKKLKAMIQKSLDERKKLDKKVREAKKAGTVFEHRNKCAADKKALKEMDDGPIGGKLLYVDRDSASRKEFTIGIYTDFDGAHYPMVDGVPFKIFTMESVYERYQTLQGYWFRARAAAATNLGQKGILPPPTLRLILCPQDVVDAEAFVPKSPDELAAEAAYLTLLEDEVRLLPTSFWPSAEFEWSYSPERIETLFQVGALGKTKHDKYLKDRTGTMRLGDWQCNYCSVAGHCLSQARPELLYAIQDVQAMMADSNTEVEFVS
jgi:hypothetical protein